MEHHVSNLFLNGSEGEKRSLYCKKMLIYVETFYSNPNGRGLCFLSLLTEDISVFKFPLEMKMNHSVFIHYE